ncbi:MAG: DUF4339 domain-containing protein [Planctomycetes bacterium]|nr:DUF4339 domain-containing protein [Planctomycetota bacterium]
MGIRFLCPNGHKLNVKAFLAGERGICPQCDAKFLVPRESGGQVEAIEEVVGVGSGNDSGDASQRDSNEPPPAPSLPPAPTVETAATEEAWHVRMASGEQFGPASDEVMRGWVAEGRVPLDCWVWRTGWPDWKPGGQAITLLNGPAAPATPVVPPAPSPAPATLPDATIPDAAMPDATMPDATMTDDGPTPTSPNAHYLNSKRNRKDRARKATFFLGGLVFLLLVILVVVLMKK